MSSTPTINMEATGANIKSLIKANGLKISEIQAVYGFNTPQSIFKWMRGEAMPSVDNLVILAHILGVTIDNIIIIN
ncbi:MAG: helix-turn-helix transcriptional regulator [Ruminococcus sp.]|uniref:helix-turn-helix domain-containing protein n=1 Tax=Ruminococcus sp. TaxID=41978 RepID=UPI0025E0B2C0|nr:helix-turn-helix transcriptional regulator [Ruminococcus sp.]MBO4866782.1 helix-turn-helix transcriptional regulator [Ruminococcus sp.]